jgi:hypothetical protein
MGHWFRLYAAIFCPAHKSLTAKGFPLPFDSHSAVKSLFKTLRQGFKITLSHYFKREPLWKIEPLHYGPVLVNPLF